MISYGDAAFLIVMFSMLCAFFGWVFGTQSGYMEGHTAALKFAQQLDRLVAAASVNSSNHTKEPK